jgi:hypothetical protein
MLLFYPQTAPSAIQSAAVEANVIAERLAGLREAARLVCGAVIAHASGVKSPGSFGRAHSMITISPDA